MTARYDAVSHWYQQWVCEQTDDPAMAAVLDLVEQCAGARVLDLGCGEGRVARAVAERGASVVGVDVSAALIDRARSVELVTRFGVSYLEADAATRSWWDGTPFDGVVSNVALSDIDDLGAALATVASVLKPGGWFVFTILHPCFPGPTADCRAGRPPATSTNVGGRQEVTASAVEWVRTTAHSAPT